MDDVSKAALREQFNSVDPVLLLQTCDGQRRFLELTKPPSDEPVIASDKADVDSLRIACPPLGKTARFALYNVGETDEEILQVMRDLRAHDVDVLTIGQYLMRSGDHLRSGAISFGACSKCLKKRLKMGFVYAAVDAM